MSMALTSDTGATTGCTSSAWEFYLALARTYGWAGRGTLPPDGLPSEEWEGAYNSNDGQRVTPDDAAGMASALERVLADPARQDRQREVIREIGREVRELTLKLHGIELPDEDDNEPLASDDDLKALVSFLKQGGFRIE
jgi:hypothetical protein